MFSWQVVVEPCLELVHGRLFHVVDFLIGEDVVDDVDLRLHRQHLNLSQDQSQYRKYRICARDLDDDIFTHF